MKKYYKPKLKNVAKLKTYLDKKTKQNDGSKRHSTSRVS
jgi:hypothetical protein